MSPNSAQYEEITARILAALELESRAPAEWLVRELESYVGGLSNPSKMPGHAYSLPAAECRTGSKLVKQEGTTCSGCYALKGRYAFPNVQRALYRRLDAIERPLWAAAMGELITRKGEPYFRWHDSGDLQSVKHLADIVDVCQLTPTVRHWLPTREYRTVADYLATAGAFPANLNVRMSAHIVGGAVPTFRRMPVTVSTVSRDEPPAGARRCPAPLQGNACGSCRACWDLAVPIVDYHLH